MEPITVQIRLLYIVFVVVAFTLNKGEFLALFWDVAKMKPDN